MKRPVLRRLLGWGLLLVLLAGAGVGAVLGSRWGQRQLMQRLQTQLARDSELVAGPFRVEFSVLRDFPHLTASVRHLTLTDTAYGRPMPVLRVGRADLRLDARELLHGRVRVRRLLLADVSFFQYTDARGRSWSLRGRRPAPGQAARGPATFALDSLLLRNVHLSTVNEFKRSTLAVRIRRAGFTARTTPAAAVLRGTLAGQLDYLRTRGGYLLRGEEIRAHLQYRYDFGRRQGQLLRTTAVLNGDTVRIRGTHTAALDQPAGTRLDLRLVGRQPLLEVLHAALPPSLRLHLAGARSPSKASIDYRIRGLSTPTVRPRTVLHFRLHNARLSWPDSGRAVQDWDLAATLDNGPARTPATTTLQVQHCRVVSAAGELRMAVRVADFSHPWVHGWLRGRTELRQLAALVAPGQWQARGGTALLDLALRGYLPERNPQRTGEPARPLSVRGTAVLHNAAFRIPGRATEVRRLHVRVGLQDSLWTLTNFTGEVAGMRVRANATTLHLLDYLTDQYPTTIRGRIAVAELRVARLRQLLAAGSQQANRRRLPARPTTLFAPGLRLDVGLSCGQLILPADTLQQLTTHLRHDGRQVELHRFSTRLWGGQVRGQARWATTGGSTANSPLRLQVAGRWSTVSYGRLLAMLARPPRPAPAAPTLPLRDMLLTATGQATLDIDHLLVPAAEDIRRLHLRLVKSNGQVQLPALRFATSGGGTGQASATAYLRGSRVARITAQAALRYDMLDVQHLLQLLAALVPDQRPEGTGRRTPTPGAPRLTDLVTARLRVSADQVRYGVLRGTGLRLESSVRPGQAVLKNCRLQALGGSLAVRAHLHTTASAGRYPVQAQAEFKEMHLPEVFSLAQTLQLAVPAPHNVRGVVRGAADVRSTLDADFLPRLQHTHAYLQTQVQGLELLDVDALMQALRFLREKRTRHLVFEPLQAQLFLDKGLVLLPDLRLPSNLTDLAVSGEYALTGQHANLYIGLRPTQALFGNNNQRVARIQQGETAGLRERRLTYVHLQRAPGTRYQVRLFKGREQRLYQQQLLRRYQALLRTQQLDTTLQLLP